MDEALITKIFNEGLGAVISLVNNLSCNITVLKDLLSSSEIESQQLKAIITDYEARLNKSSDNSSKPPSSDGYKKPPTNNREKSGRTTGGQPGHVGSTLNKVLNPDLIIEYNTPEFCDCGCDLKGVEIIKKTRQVHEIPEPKIHVTEHVTNETVCPNCKKVHKTDFPPQVTQPTQYGENMQTLMNYLTQYQFIPLERAVELISALTGQTVSEGTLVNASKALNEHLTKVVEDIKQKIIASDVVHFDETGMRSEDKLQWLHVASTEWLTYFGAHEKRGKEATIDIGILPNFKGTAVHDHWMPYYSFNDCTHSECNSHNLRYLKDITENYKQDWANEMAGVLVTINRRVGDLKMGGASEMSKEELQVWYGKYHTIIDKGITEDGQKSPLILNKKGKPKKSKPLQLLLKLQKYDIETLAFMYDFEIPFTNNLSERDVRMQKLRQKISGCFRSKKGMDAFCTIRSYISTAKKNGINAMEAIRMAVKGNPFVPSV